MKEVLIPKKAIFPFLTIGVLPLMLASSVFAEDVVSNVSLSIPSACSISGTGTGSHVANINNGTYEEDIGKTTLKVFCNDSEGFAVYAVGYTGSEIGATNSTKLVGAGSGVTIDTGTYTQGTTVDSVWAMKISKVTNTSGQPDITYNPNNLTIENGFGSYHAVPANYTKVASFSSTTDTTLGSKLETTYAAFISGTQRADTYNGKVKYTLVHPANAINLIACNPNATTISEVVCLQDFAHVSDVNYNAIVSSMTPGVLYTLKDSRDNKTYTVAKYTIRGGSYGFDIWMMQNLDLDLDANTTYTNENTDIGYNSSTAEYDVAAWSPDRSTYTSLDQWCAGGTISNGSCSSNNTPESLDVGDLYWNGMFYETEGLDWDTFYDNCQDPYTCDLSFYPLLAPVGTAQHHLGNYYNWNAAVAMNNTSAITGTTTVNQSICPAGWTLPDSDTTNALLDAIDSYEDIFNSFALNGIAYYAEGIYIDGIGGYGGLWGNKVLYDGNNIESTVLPYNAYEQVSKTAGSSIRCIVRHGREFQ